MATAAGCDLVRRATSLLPALVDDTLRMVRCESPSADLDAVARSAGVVAAVGERVLGAAPRPIVRDGVTHLLWSFGARARVLLLCHHDTVWPIGSLETHPAQVSQGVLRGPGCFDMKAGLAMALHALGLLGERDGVSLLVTGDEEVGSPSSRTLIEEQAAGRDAVLVLEAAAEGGAIKIARKGVSTYEIAVVGRAAHAGLEPERGVNAGVELAHQILAVTALGDPHGGTSVVPTVASAGTTANTVPATARVAVDVRAWTRAEQQRVDADLRALRPVDPAARLQVLGAPNRPPLERTASAGLLLRAQRVAADLGLAPLPTAEVGGGSDGNFTAGIGVPTLDGLGAVGGGAHADGEHVLIDHLPGRTALLAALIADVRGDAG